MQNKIDVKMGEFIVSESPNIIQSMGIGSCVVVCIYDKKNKLGGLAHIMAAKSNMDKEVKPTRFADKAIKMMVKAMKNMGADNGSLSAKIIGGASMFPGVTQILAIGSENIIAVRKELDNLKIKVIAEDTGGNEGRSVWFDTSNGDVVVGKIKGETRTI
jgi:chemotaxis protein CheD